MGKARMMKGLGEFQLKQRIGHLSKRKQVALALLLCERMVPALNKFAKETGFDSSVYREHLDDGWHSLDQGTSSSNYGEAAKRCLDHAPDTEDYSSSNVGSLECCSFGGGDNGISRR
jgi:uncharacterized protein YjaG (DUF416 family)